MTIDGKITRRSLAKVLAASGTLVGLSGLAGADTQSVTPVRSHNWTKVFPGVWRVRAGMPERFTPVSARMVAPQTDAFLRLPKVDTAPLGPIEGARTERGFMVRLPLSPGEQIYGLGLQMLSFAQRGKKKTLRVNADPKLDTGDSHAPVPFYVTTEGIGVLIDTARYATFYLGSAHARPADPEHDANGKGIYDPTQTHAVETNRQDAVMVEVPVAAGVDIYLFAGPGMLDAVRRYNLFSGGGFVPPEWGLGLFYRAETHSNQPEALAIAGDLRERKIPCDVLGLEPGWQSHAYSCTFVWSKERFPDPPAFLRNASRMQFKVNLWEHAFTHPDSPLFLALKPHSGDFGVWGGLVPDFASDPAREIFGAFHGKTLIDAGVSGFKLDECDNSDNTGAWSFPEISRFPSGVDGEQMHSVFGTGYQMAVRNEFKKRRMSAYGLVRSSGALAAPLPFVLYSDLYEHRVYIRALVNSGFSGLLWCPEVRQAATAEDLIRRLQSAVFSPLAQVDCWYIKNPPWKQIDRAKNNAGELMENWEELESRCREIIGWRMQLVPYLTAAFQRYAADGTPPFRALVLDTPKDPHLQNVDDQYLVGDRMMVAPLFAGEPDRAVVLPQGAWHNFWTGEKVQGGTKLTVTASTEKIPVYVKSGSIIPWSDVGQHAGAPETYRLAARVYGDGSMPFAWKTEQGSMRLTWKNGRGTVEGERGSYDVYTWQQIG